MSVIIATWNACAVLGRCLDSLASQKIEGGFETIVVDNASTDATAELLRRYGASLRVITNDQNAGFSLANNQGAAEARGRVLLFLNSDTELLAPDVLERLATAAEQEEVGLVGPMLVNPDGSLQPSCAAYPAVTTALLLGSGLHRLLPDGARARIVPQFWSHDRAADTDWVMGAAVALRADLFHAVGGFWPTMYAEETDIAYRIKQRGLKVRFDPAARIMHIGNFSNSQRWSEPERAARVARAELAFVRTHYGAGRGAAIRVIACAGFAARALAHALLLRPETARVFRSMARVYSSAPLERARTETGDRAPEAIGTLDPVDRA
jgi:GT2 family glycosyltransferase